MNAKKIERNEREGEGRRKSGNRLDLILFVQLRLLSASFITNGIKVEASLLEINQQKILYRLIIPYS